MFFIRYSWTLPSWAQIAIGIALLVVLACAHGSNAAPHEFAVLHHNRCLQQQPSPAINACTTRTIQLASHMHGQEFGEQVAAALR